MSMEQPYVYSVFLPTGRRLTQYVSKDPPPSSGETITLDVNGTLHNFEVLASDEKKTLQFRSIILKVQPILPS